MHPSSSEKKNQETWEILRQHAVKSQPEMSSSTIRSKIEAERKEQDQPIVGYQLLDKMGSGSTGVVFKALNKDTEEQVALKLLYPGHDKDPKVLEQFINEGMTLVRLDHSNIIKGLDFGVSKGFYFLALEFMEGESILSQIESQGRFSEVKTLRVLMQICQALAYLEEQNIVHRDIKPANILLFGNTAKLCDFTLSLDLGKVKEKGTEKSEVTCGTVEYISPEQAKGEQDIDGRSDIYSLGITCLHMLTGSLPFTGEDSYEIMRQHIYEKIKLREMGNFSSGVQNILTLMLEKNKDYRLSAFRLLHVIGKYLKRKQ